MDAKAWILARGIVFVVAGSLQAWALAKEHGIVWPDEIHQSLEQAHRLVYGFGCLPWEFEEGARHWLYPGLLASVLRGARVLGFEGVRMPVYAGRGFMAVVSVATVLLAMQLARRLAGPAAAVTGGVLLATFPLWFLFGSRCMSEVASAPLLVMAVLFQAERSSPLRLRAAGVVAAISCFVRFQNGIVAAGLLVVLLLPRDRRAALHYAQGGSVAALAGGLVDFLTWGRPFHSFLAYVDFNIIHGRSDAFGVAAAGYYLEALWSSTGPLLFLVGGLVVLAARHHPGLTGVVLMYIGLHCAVPHKEARFLVPVLPLLFVLAGAGVGRALSGIRLAPLGVVAAAASLAGIGVALVWRAGALTLADLGYSGVPGQSAWHVREGYNRLLWQAAIQKDLCGVGVVGARLVQLGGHSYLHRDVPLVGGRDLARPQGYTLANYLIAPAKALVPSDYAPVGGEAGVVLFRREGGCLPPPQGYRPFFPRPR